MVRARRRSLGEMFEWEKRESWFDGPRETGTPCHLSGDRLYRLARLDRHRLLTAGKAHKYAWVARWKSISSYSLARRVLGRAAVVERQLADACFHRLHAHPSFSMSAN